MLSVFDVGHSSNLDVASQALRRIRVTTVKLLDAPIYLNLNPNFYNKDD